MYLGMHLQMKGALCPDSVAQKVQRGELGWLWVLDPDDLLTQVHVTFVVLTFVFRKWKSGGGEHSLERRSAVHGVDAGA